MERGHRWEQPIADAVLSLTGLHVVGEQMWCEWVGNSRHRATADGFLAPTASASFDDLVGGFECKTHGAQVTPDYDAYETQCQWLMHVVGLPMVLLAVARINDADDTLDGLRLKRIERNDELIDELVTLADRLLVHLYEGTLPEPEPTSLDAVKAINAAADDTPSVDLSDMADDVARWSEAKEDMKTLDEWLKGVEVRIRHAMAGATVGSTGTHTVKVGKPARILTDTAESLLLAEHPELGIITLDKDAAKAQYPELVDSLRTPIGARRLTITKSKGTNK
jgi:hypothetical protein